MVNNWNNTIAGWWWLEHFFIFHFIYGMILPIDIFQDGYNHQPVSIESGFPGNEGNEGNDGLTGVLLASRYWPLS